VAGDALRMTTRFASTLALTAAAVALAAAPAAHAATNDISTVAGTTGGLSGDLGPATRAQLHYPHAIAATADGGYLIADTQNDRIRKVSRGGMIRTVAGTTAGFSGDGGHATAAQLNRPHGVAATADGGFLIADTSNNRIRKVSPWPNETITTVAGTGTAGLAGDGGSAIAAELNHPTGVAATADGGFLIADYVNDRVRKVSPTGTITTVAGSTEGLSGDGGPAIHAQLDGPFSIAGTADGGFLIADDWNSRVRKVSPTGTITTVAGTTGGLSGDGGPAIAAKLENPTAVTAAPDGGFVIADRANNRIRRVSPTGTITTIAGTTYGLAGDGGPATLARLGRPAGVAVTSRGRLLIADSNNSRIRFVDIDLRIPDKPPAPPAPPAPPVKPASGGSPTPASSAAPATPAAPSKPAASPNPASSRLGVTLVTKRVTAQPRRVVAVRYMTTQAAAVELRIMRGQRRVSRIYVDAAQGRNTVRVRVPQRTGNYRLVLAATSSSGHRATDSALLAVKRTQRAR
jgi:hypothetical protein